MKRILLGILLMMGVLVLAGCGQFNSVMEKADKYLDIKLEQLADENYRECCCSCDDDNNDNDGGLADASGSQNDDGNDVTDNDFDEKNNNDDEGGKRETPTFERRTYESDQGDEVEMQFGELAFATRVVSFTVGNPVPEDRYLDTDDALGEPDYDYSVDSHAGFLTLGGSGEVILEFENVYLVDGPGDDLYIFEVGPSVEPMELSISEDGENWIEIGKAEGGQSSVDIEPFVDSNDKFSFVKLVDLRHNVGMPSPGADIDAVGVINGQVK